MDVMSQYFWSVSLSLLNNLCAERFFELLLNGLFCQWWCDGFLNGYDYPYAVSFCDFGSIWIRIYKKLLAVGFRDSKTFLSIFE